MSGHLLRFPSRAPAPSLAGLELYKLQPPPLADGVAAVPAAVDALDARAEGPITVLEGPAGAGKTTLLTTWFGQTARPAGWMTVEPDDEDPVRFAVHLVAAVHRAQPELAHDLNGLCSLPPSSEIEAIWAEHFVAPLRESGARGVIVLDDLQHVLDDERCTSALAWLTRNMPSGLSLICASDRPVRFAHGDPHARARAKAAAAPVPHVLRLHGLRADGAAVVDPTTVHPFGPSGVVEAGPTEDLDAAPDPDRIAPLAVADRVCGPLADRLLGVEDGASRLAALAHANVGVRAEDERGQWYRLTPALRAALLAELGTEAHAAAHAAAAAWCFEHGLIARAVHHVEVGGEPARAVVHLETWGDRALARRALGPLARLVALWPHPEEVARLDAWRLLAFGAPRLARATLIEAELGEDDPDVVAAMALAALRAGREAEAKARLQGAPEAPEGSRAAAALALVRGRLADDGAIDEAQEDLQAAAEHALSAGHAFLAIEAARYEIEALVRVGRVDDAQERLRAAEGWLATEHLSDAAPDAALGCARAAVALAKHRWGDAIASAGRALDVLDPMPVASDRALLVTLMQTALLEHPAPEADGPVLEVVRLAEGHRGFARRLGVSVASARLRVQDALEPHGVERWWQWLMGGASSA